MSPTLPDVLADPPWARPRKKAAGPPPLALAVLPFTERVLSDRPPPVLRTEAPWIAQCRDDIERSRRGEKIYVSALSGLPDDEALAFWSDADPAVFRGGDYDGRNLVELVERLGLAVLPGLLRYAEGKLPSALPALLVIESPRVAPYVAEAFAFGKKVVGPEAWLLDHPEAAALGLVPAACSPVKRRREAAGAALRFLAGTGRRAAVLTAADRYGPEARALVDTVLRDDLPARVRSIPSFVALAALPPLRLAGGGALPPSATEALVTMLVMTRRGPAYSGLLDAREACDPASLRALVWAVFEQWEAAGCPPADEWALLAVGHLGGDGEVERLVARLPEWQRTGAAQRTEKGIEAIALVGTPLAFTHLDRLARKARYMLLREAASAAVLRVARRLAIHPDELEDRQAPDLGLDASGAMTFTRAGRPAVTATLDEHLSPLLVDASGKRLKSFPKALGPEEAARFKALAKGARLAAESQIARFERAMLTERTWAPSTFLEVVVGHPVLRHLARRVVWSVTRGTGPIFFRVAEDGTLADAGDEALVLDPATDGPVRIAHPVALGPEGTRAFGQIFSDYEIIQPFPQLARPAFTLRPDEIAAGRLLRFEGATVGWEAVSALPRRGFADTSYSERMFSFYRALPFGVSLGVTVEPGVSRGDPRQSGPQRVVTVSTSGRALGELSPVAASEVVLAASVLAAAPG